MLNTTTIGKRILAARKKINISQAELAERMFISAQAVGKWERGESMPDIISFNRLAEILEVDLNYFTGDIESRSAALGRDKIESPEMEPAEDKLKGKPKWDMSQGNWVDADFSGLINLHEKFSGSNMQRCQFIDSDLSGLHLKGNHIESCDFRGSNISGSHIQGCEVVGNLFNDCLLTEATFSGSHIQGCDFSGVDFSGASMKTCSFQKNTITGALLNRTFFISSDLYNIVFEGTIEDSYFENSSVKSVVFQNSRLINTFFKNTSLKRVKFIDCEADRLTYEFMKTAKADLTGVSIVQGKEVK